MRTAPTRKKPKTTSPRPRTPTPKPTARAKQAPMHQRIREYILQQIRAGKWHAEDRIPSEHELRGRFGVSRMTVIQAIRDLCKEGVLTRAQGSGTFIAQPQIHLTVVGVSDIAGEIRARGHSHQARVIERLKRSATETEAKLFHVEPGSTLFHGLVLHLEDGTPVQLEDRLVNPGPVPGFLEIDYAETTSFAYLMRLFPYPAGRHVIRSIEATALMREVLKLKPGEPALEIERTTWVGDTVVTVVRLIHPGFRYELSGTIGR